MSNPAEMPAVAPVEPLALVQCQAESVVSRTLLKRGSGGVARTPLKMLLTMIRPA